VGWDECRIAKIMMPGVRSQSARAMRPRRARLGVVSDLELEALLVDLDPHCVLPG